MPAPDVDQLVSELSENRQVKVGLVIPGPGAERQWLRSWIQDRDLRPLAEEMVRQHGELMRDLPDDGVSVQQLVSNRVKAQTLGDYFLDEAGRAMGGLSSKRGVELAKLAVHFHARAESLAKSALDHATAIVAIRKSKEREAASDGRAIFTSNQ